MPADVKAQDWAAVAAAEKGPALGDVVVALVPALRALFLMGYRAMSVNFTSTTGGELPISWVSIDLKTLALSGRTLAMPRPRNTLNIVLELEELCDLDPRITGTGFGMPLPAEPLGTDAELTGGPGLPESLQASIDTFVAQAVAALVPRMPSGAPAPAAIGVSQLPKATAGGMVWLLDPEHWTGFDAEITEDLKNFVWKLTKQASRVITGQVYARRGTPDPLPDDVPTLGWLFTVIAKHEAGFGGLSIALRQHLQARGMSHLLNHDRLARMFWSEQAYEQLWLDVLIELVCLGVIRVDGLLEPAEPDEPLVVIDHSEGEIDLVVWGERVVTLRREAALTGATSVRGSATWEYVPGDATCKATLVVVAARGISITKKPVDVYGWELAVFRVQRDTLVPDQSEAIDPWSFLSSQLVGDRSDPAPDVVNPASLLTRPRPDGLYLEFPVFGDVEPPPDDEIVDDDKPLPFVLTVTVDPLSAWDWYCVDVHFYTYIYEAETRTAAHLVVWATPGVTVRCSDNPGENRSSPTGTDNGARASHEPLAGRPVEPPWRVSAEIWATMSEPFPELWATRLPVAYETVTGSGPEPLTLDEPALEGTEGEDLVPYTSPDGAIDVLLSRVSYLHEQFNRHERRMLDLVDTMIGLIPVIGDIADTAETAHAWITGYDRWGRPVSDFQLVLMTILTPVPFISGSFASSLGRWVDGVSELRGVALGTLFRRSVAGLDLADSEFAEVLSASDRFAVSKAKGSLITALREYVEGNPGIVAAYVTRTTGQGGAVWLSLADIRHPTRPGFRINLIDDDFVRYRARFPTASEEQFLRQGISRGARVLAESLLGPGNVRRSIPRPAPEPFLAYRPVPAPTTTVTEIAEGQRVQDVIDTVRQVAQEALDRPESMRLQTVGHGGYVADAKALVPFNVNEIVQDIDGLLRHVSAGRPETATAAQLCEVLGEDLLNKRHVTLHERAYRVVEALVTARYEILRFAEDTLVLVDARMIEPLRDFVRAMVGRPRYPHGARGELRVAGTLLLGFARDPVVLRTQQPMPDLLGGQLRAGSDHTLYRDLGTPNARAFPVQVKAISDLNHAGLGKVRLVLNKAGKVVGVKGPNIIAQVIRDELRRLPWNDFLPPPGLARPPLVAPTDPLAEGWVRDDRLRFVVLDDEFLAEQLLQILYDTAKRMGTASKWVDVNDLDVSPGLRLMIQNGFANPSRINLKNVDRLRDDIKGLVIPSIAADLEDDIARTMAEFEHLLPAQPQIVVICASEGVEPIRRLLFPPKPAP